ncbi:MAG: spore germination protein [Ruminococcus sp.]|nr:spore germination protein [Ruminococcus sp.]
MDRTNRIKLPPDLDAAERELRALTGDPADLNIQRFRVGGTGCMAVSAEGMAAGSMVSDMLFRPLMEYSSRTLTPAEVQRLLLKEGIFTPDRQAVTDMETLCELVFSGFVVIMTETLTTAAAFGIQGYEKRAVASPESEQTVSAAHDCFIEAVRTNLSLIRRRLKTPLLRSEMIKVGRLSVCDVCLVYIKGRADEETLRHVREELKRVRLDTVLTSGCLQPFLDKSYQRSVFSAVMTTERPDMAVTCLNEGKVVIIIDGTPFVLILPTLFADNFRTMDDYTEKTFHAALSRAMKYLAFLLAVGFPGLYVALVTFHPEVFSLKLLLNLAVSEEATPYPLSVEVFMLMILFEIMREAGVRLPKAVGGAVSIVGGLIIGDAAVKSGIVSQPLLIVVGVTATASFVLPDLYPAVSALRLVFILAGGAAGLFGLAAAAFLLTVNICAVDEEGIPFTAPAEPFDRQQFFDSAFRRSFFDYERTRRSISDLKEERP